MRIPIQTKPLKEHKTRLGKALILLMRGFVGLFLLLTLLQIALNGYYSLHKGDPVKSVKSMLGPGELTDIAINDESLFLLYATPGVVMAYSHDGVYQYAVQFPYDNNSSASLFASGNDLYYRNRWDSVWHMRGGVCQQVWTLEEGAEKLAELKAADPAHQDTVCWYGDVRYEIHGQDVLRILPDGTEECVVDGLEVLSLLEFRPLWMGAIYSLTGVILTSFGARKAEERQQKQNR